MKRKRIQSGFGLIIVGSEILDGRIQDKHFENTRRLLKERNHPLRYAIVLSDEPGLILAQLKWAMAQPEPFFCCGGIGSTPDDYTRQCAAEAVGLGLEHNPEGVKILERRLGSNLTEARLNLVLFPEGATLIPNPVNQIPGFSLGDGHFLPGFPSMAEPMTAWVLDTYYEPGEVTVHRAFVVPAREADLTPLMEEFVRSHQSLTLSSLPKYVEGGTEVKLGISGTPEDVEKGSRDLLEKLQALGLQWREEG
ncbi:MAG TPA: molybdopterin-binding protein [Syntrophobacteria bacterium]|nr:molybdopterin-binding protein [Syntrophobacteria bacterium]